MKEENVSVPTTPRRTEGRGVQSVELGARLLYELAAEGEPMMLKDLAQMAGLAPAQAHAYMVSYRRIGLVEKDPESGKYRLGRFSLDLGIARMRTSDPLIQASHTVMALSRKTRLNAALVVWGSFGPTVVELHESGSQINMNTRPGTVYSMSGTASGRVFTAHMPDRVVKEAIAREKREGGRVGVARFISKNEIEQIREAGYSTIYDPPVPGITAFAAPILDYADQLVCVITIIGEDHHIKHRIDGELVPALLESSRKLSADLGYGSAFNVMNRVRI